MTKLYSILLGALGFTPTLFKKARDALSNDDGSSTAENYFAILRENAGDASSNDDELSNNGSSNNGPSTAEKWLKFLVYCSLGVTDCFDAISDLIISIQTILDPECPSDSEDSGGSGRGYALLLFSMAILGRVLNGYYSDVVLNNPMSERTFFRLGTTVFLLEDGAFILLLATRNGTPAWFEATSSVLTAICGIGYAVTDTYVLVGLTAPIIQLLLAQTTLFVIFDMCILFTFVIFRGNKGVLSGTLLTITLVIYVLGCIFSLISLSWQWAHFDAIKAPVDVELKKIAELTANNKDKNAPDDIEQSAIGSKDVPVAAAGSESKMIEEESHARSDEMAADENTPDDIKESAGACYRVIPSCLKYLGLEQNSLVR